MLERLIQEVWLANISLREHGLVLFSWGNVSAVDRERGVIVIKPSGADYDEFYAEDMSVVDFSGKLLRGQRQSLDTDIHLAIYEAFSHVGGVAHTHSTHATAWAQTGCDLPAMGSTHAAYFHGDIPCTRPMPPQEISPGYEKNTGRRIADVFRERGLDPRRMPSVLVNSHGPFSWGGDAREAVHNAVILENVAEIALKTLQISASRAHLGEASLERELLDRHYQRRHGS